MLGRVHWRELATGLTGHGRLVSETLAMESVKFCNAQERGKTLYWFERVTLSEAVTERLRGAWSRKGVPLFLHGTLYGTLRDENGHKAQIKRMTPHVVNYPRAGLEPLRA